MQISTTRPASGSSPHWLVLAGITAVAYFLVGLSSLALTLPPGYASPLFPSAGIALVMVMSFGPRMTVGVVAGSLALNAIVFGGPAATSATSLSLACVLAASAALQSLFGSALARRFVGAPLVLDQPRQIAAFYLIAGAGGCLLNATALTTALAAFGVLPAGAAFATWTTCWIGDTMGVLIGAPIVLTLIGRPAALWAPRRLTVGLPLLVLAVLLTMAIAQIGRWDRARDAAGFDRDADGAERSMQQRLNESLYALEAMHGLFIASDEVTRVDFHRAAASWLAMPIGLQALGWTEFVTSEQRASFESRARADGLSDFAVFDRLDSGERIPTPADRSATAIRFIEPVERNRTAFGVNGLSIAQARDAIEATRRFDLPQATAGMRLAQEAEQQKGVVVYQAVFDQNGEKTAGDAGRQARFAGAVFMTLRMDDTLNAVAANLPPYLRLCLTERAGAPGGQTAGKESVGQRRLAGPTGCEAVSTSPMSRTKALEFAGQHWELRVTADPAWITANRNWNAWLLSLVGLLGAAMMGALLLTVTGRARRIEQAVHERTAALQHEIAEREQTAAALRESEQRFRNIFNNVPIGVTYTDLHGRVMQSNPKFCQFTGYSPEELLGMTALDYTHPDDRAQDRELSAQLVNGDIPMFRRHERYLAKNGQVLWVQATVSLLRDAQGRPRRIVAVVEDITEHLRLLEAERARETAEAANKAKSDFLSRMSHELRTPLNAMLGFAQLLELDERHPLAPSQRQWAGQIQQAGWHLLEMINDVLDLSRIESGTLRLHLQTLELPELLAASIALVQAAADRRGISITHDIADGTTSMVGDMTRVKQILINLLSNAVKYNCDAGRIHISTRVSGPSSIDIAITDTGIGMTGDQLANLFQPFNRLGREHTQTEGTGIGLMISQRLAELMGGSLRARSVAGEGSSFIVTLPVAPDPDSVRSGLDDLGESTPYYHRRLVHYVEDNETNIEVMRGVLAQRPQIELEVSMNGLDGLRAIQRTLPSLVLLDLHLPDIDGFEVLRRLKEDLQTADIPVVVVSADALMAQREAALAAGAWDYMTKPVTVSKLLGAVDELLLAQDTRFD